MQERRPFNSEFNSRAHADLMIGGDQNPVFVYIHYPALSGASGFAPESSILDPQFDREANFGTPLQGGRI